MPGGFVIHSAGRLFLRKATTTKKGCSSLVGGSLGSVFFLVLRKFGALPRQESSSGFDCRKESPVSFGLWQSGADEAESPVTVILWFLLLLLFLLETFVRRLLGTEHRGDATTNRARAFERIRGIGVHSLSELLGGVWEFKYLAAEGAKYTSTTGPADDAAAR